MQQTDISLSKSYLLDVIDEVSYRQASAIEALDREVERQRIYSNNLTIVKQRE